MAESLLANVDSKPTISLQRGLVDPQFQVVAPINHSSSQKTMLNDLSHGLKIWTDLSAILSQVTRLTDGQTDGPAKRIIIARPRLHSMQRGKTQHQFTCAVITSKVNLSCIKTKTDVFIANIFRVSLFEFSRPNYLYCYLCKVLYF